MKRKPMGFAHENMTDSEKRQTETTQLKDIPPAKINTGLNTDRIKSAIVKGKQTLLPSDTKGQNLSKFEHNGRDGPLVVFAQEALHHYNKLGHYKVITALKPAESLRNQLFFANESTKHNKEVLIKGENSHVCDKHSSRVSSSKRAKKEAAPMDRFVDRKGNHRDKKMRRQITNPDSFEELIERYKSRREMYKDLMGAGHVEVLDKLDGLYRQRKQERLKLQTQFSNLGEIRTEINATTGLRDHIIDLEEVSKEETGKDPVKLPRIRVSTVAEVTRQESRRKLDRKHLVVPREKRTGALKMGKLGAQVNVDSLGKHNEATNYETVTISFPKL